MLKILCFLPLLSSCGAVGLVYPPMKIYMQENEGKAELAKAEYQKQAMVHEARAKLEAAKLESLAEIERAKGAAEANRIIGESLKGNEAYLRYLWVQGLNDGNSEVIYIPTEANLPILEARENK